MYFPNMYNHSGRLQSDVDELQQPSSPLAETCTFETVTNYFQASTARQVNFDRPIRIL